MYGHVRRGALVALKLACSAALIAWLAHSIDLGDALARLGGIDPAWLAAAAAVLGIQALLGAWRWRRIVLLQGGALDPATAVRLFLIGMFVNQTLSSTVGGDALRAWRLRSSGLPLAVAAEGIVLERLSGLVTLAAVAVAALPFAAGSMAFALIVLALLGASVAGLAVLADIAAGALGPRFARWTRLARTGRSTLGSRIGVPILAAALAIHLLGALAVWLVAQALALDLALLPCLVLVPPTILLATLPISFGGWGVREGAMVFALGAIGTAPGDALALSVGFGLLVMAAGLPGSLVWLSGR